MCEVAMDCAAERQEGGPIGAGAPGRVGSGRGSAAAQGSRRTTGRACREGGNSSVDPVCVAWLPGADLTRPRQIAPPTGFAAPGLGTAPGDEAGGRAELSQGTRTSSTLA
jgi:hypothetical protein